MDGLDIMTVLLKVLGNGLELLIMMAILIGVVSNRIVTEIKIA